MARRLRCITLEEPRAVALGNEPVRVDSNVVGRVTSGGYGYAVQRSIAYAYLPHEVETGKLSSYNLRFYHPMYQILALAMNVALSANNIGLMWVAVELATLTTVVMVGLYRTAEALEAAWANVAKAVTRG